MSEDLRSLHLSYVSELSEVRLDLIIADLRNQSTNEDLASARLSLLRVNLLVVDDVIASSDDLIDGVSRLVDDEGEPSRASGGGVCLDVDALDLTILPEVIAEFLCEKGEENKVSSSLIRSIAFKLTLCGLPAQAANEQFSVKSTQFSI